MGAAVSISFYVRGWPATQGGMKPVPVGKTGQVRLISAGSAGLKAWRKAATHTAALARNTTHHVTFDDIAVEVSLRFFLPMPKSRPAAERRRGIGHSRRRPDIDKLTRAMLDSLTAAQVYTDDGQVTRLHVRKFEVLDDRLLGCSVFVRSVSDDDVDVDALAHHWLVESGAVVLREQTP